MPRENENVFLTIFKFRVSPKVFPWENLISQKSSKNTTWGSLERYGLLMGGFYDQNLKNVNFELNQGHGGKHHL